MTDVGRSVPQQLNAGDVYIYAHGNGAIFVLFSDTKSRLAPLPEALSIASDCHRAGCGVLIASDPGPIASAVVEQIRAAGIPTVDFPASEPPHRWDHGTTALMEAAHVGSDDILDDLIARGLDLDEQDDSGATALHHAALEGNSYAIEALIAAGASPTKANRRGFTPQMLAIARGQHAAAAQIEALASIAPERDVRFHRIHFVAVYFWFLPLVMLVAVVFMAWPFGVVVGIVLALFFVGYALVFPPRAFWAGGVVRELAGDDLTVSNPVGRKRVIDLRAATYAALGGSSSQSRYVSARWVVLAHPDGIPVDRRNLGRLLLHPGEVDEALQYGDRFVVVIMSGAYWAMVLAAVGGALRRLETPLSRPLAFDIALAQAPFDGPWWRRR